jgi:hypothetical protein
VQRQWVAGPGGGGEAPAGGTPFVTDPTAAQGAVEVRRFDFQVQFCWQPKTPTERQEAREKIKREAAAALAAQQ